MSKSKKEIDMGRKKIEENIIESVPCSQNYAHIQQRIDFDYASSLSLEPEKNRLSVIIASLLAGFIALSSTATAISLLITKTKSEVSNINRSLPALGLIAAEYYKSEASVSQNVNDVDIIYTLEEYKSYLDNNEFVNLENAPLVLSEHYFDYCCLVAVNFFCSEIELNVDNDFDGEGPKIDLLSISNNTFLAYISVPQLGDDDFIYRKVFFVLSTIEEINECSNYSFVVIQRNTGNKGSKYYDKNGEKR